MPPWLHATTLRTPDKTGTGFEPAQQIRCKVEDCEVLVSVLLAAGPVPTHYIGFLFSGHGLSSIVERLVW
jgi:hypothetical protein